MDDLPDLDALLSDDTGESEEQRVLAELEARKEEFKFADGYALFDLWEGCGRDALEDAFYGEWVKTHHPDRYNSHRSSDITMLANEVFLVLQDKFDALLKLEKTDEPTRPRPAATPQPSSSTTSPGSTSSGTASQTTSPVSTSASSTGPSASATASPADGNLFAHRPTTTRRKAVDGGGEDLFSRRPTTSKRTQPRVQRPASEGLFSRRPTNARNASPAKDPSTSTTPKAEAAAPSQQARSSGSSARDDKVQGMSSLDASAQRRRAKASDTSPKARFENAQKIIRRGRQLDDAKVLLQGLVEDEPDNKVYATYLAWSRYLCDTSEAEDVKRALKSLLEEAPDTVTEDACLFLAKIALAEESNDTAQSYLRRVLKANSKNIEAQREMRLLKTRLAAQKESEAAKPGLLKRLFGGFKKS